MFVVNRRILNIGASLAMLAGAGTMCCHYSNLRKTGKVPRVKIVAQVAHSMYQKAESPAILLMRGSMRRRKPVTHAMMITIAEARKALAIFR